MTDRPGPVVIELDESDGPSPADAPPVPEPDARPPEGSAMTTAAALAARRPSRLARWFWRLAGALVAAILSIAAWDFVTALLARHPVLGWGAAALVGAFIAVALAIAVKELAAFARLSKLDALHHRMRTARTEDNLAEATGAVDALVQLYSDREDTRWGRARLDERRVEVFDAAALLDLAEREMLAPLDAAARIEVEAAARQVAAVTALVPLALADVVAALGANLRMIRRIAEIYGGRSGTLGAWRLTRAVMAHLVATGAVAVGDDMLEPILGGGVLARLSRRFGEGLVNGALTARVGVAAIEVCRPMPFAAIAPPSVRGVIRRALTGLLMRNQTAAGDR